jgi:hypothetical protein
MYYPSRNGRIAGTFKDGVVRGWWSEGSGNRAGGRADFRLVRDGGSPRLDGAWSNGTAEPTVSWDLVRVGDDIPAAARAKLEDDSLYPVPLG